MPAGDFIYGGKVLFLGQVIPAEVLEYERKDKMVLYGGPSLVEAGDLVFCLWLEDLDAEYLELDIPKKLQAEVKEILESFARIEATARPPDATSTAGPTGTPTATSTPASIISRMGAIPDPKRMLELGQWATPVPVRAMSAISSLFYSTQWAHHTSGPNQSNWRINSTGRTPNLRRQKSSSSFVSLAGLVYFF